MNVGSETETKYELDERGFERLKSAARIEKCTRQLNVYFDANWILANRAATFRIRFTPDASPEATLKLPVARNGATRTMKEIEVPLQTANRTLLPHRRLDVSRDLPFELAAEILRLGVKRLERVGWMRNTRYVVSIESGGQIELDRTTLPDGSTVFEAEIESADVAIHRKLSQFILSNVPWARPSLMSKFQRFRKAAEAINAREARTSGDVDRGNQKPDTEAESEKSMGRRLRNLFRLGRGGSKK
jgi:uncharacterized protein YjbK